MYESIERQRGHGAESVVLRALGQGTLMRIAVLTILTVAAVLTAAPVQAQTYGWNYPVCLQAYGRNGNYIDCSYVSLPQCNQSASGRAAQCIVNPYFAGAERPVGWRSRPHRSVY